MGFLEKPQSQNAGPPEKLMNWCTCRVEIVLYHPPIESSTNYPSRGDEKLTDEIILMSFSTSNFLRTFTAQTRTKKKARKKEKL